MEEAELRAWIGRTAEASDTITPRLADEFRATFAPHIPVDADAPLGIHWCLSPAIAPADGLGPDGHPPKGGFLPPVPLPRRMWAGGEVEIRAPLRVGDDVTRRSRIEDVSVKHGRSGTLCFVAVRHDYETARGIAISERHDIVYRAAATAPAPPAPPPAERQAAAMEFAVRADPVLLFRYSAVTFNGHRIHYDLPYVTNEEFYPGLVIHGPIQATLLLNMAARLGGGAPRRFSYRGVSPMTVPGGGSHTFAVRGSRSAAGLECWTEAENGVVCMTATAQAA